MSSMTAPELRGRVLHAILVVAAFGDIGLLRATEDHFAAASSPGNILFVPAYAVFFPGRGYSKQEMADLLRQRHIEAVLVITVGQAGATNYYVPPTYNSDCTEWNPVSGCTRVTTAPSGGGTYQKPWAQFEARLYDASTGTPIWVATATSGGNAFATSVTLLESMADETLGRLAVDHVILYCAQAPALDSAAARMRSDSAHFAAAVAERRAARLVYLRYLISANATPEQRRELEARNDSLAHPGREADSLIAVLRPRLTTDSQEVRVAKQAVANSCARPRP